MSHYDKLRFQVLHGFSTTITSVVLVRFKARQTGSSSAATHVHLPTSAEVPRRLGCSARDRHHTTVSMLAQEVLPSLQYLTRAPHYPLHLE